MSLAGSRFTMRNEAFSCAACGHSVPPATGTARNHCPECLASVHLDVMPGDRAANCGGVMDAIGYDVGAGGKITLVFRCRSCAAVGRNKAIQKDPEPDSLVRILELTGTNPLR